MIEYLPARVLRLTQPAAEPVSVAQARAHLRLDPNDTSDNAEIAAMIAAARARVEDFCNRPFVSADWVVLFDGRLPRDIRTALFVPVPGVTSVEAVTYRAADGSAATWAADGRGFDAERQLLRAVSAWPAGEDLRVEVTAGNADSPVAVPGPIFSAILLYIADLYELREAHVVGASYVENPAAVSLMMPYRERTGV